VEYRILGPLEVQENGRARDLGGVKQRALLTVLLLSANEVVSAGRLIEGVWGEQPPATAGKTLQVHVSRLRRALGDGERLQSRAGGYVLELQPGELDLDRFRELAEEGGHALARGEARVAEELLRQALALWRGPALADFAYESFAQAEIARLEELRLDALERWVEAELALGRHGAVIGELEALARKHPLREGLRAQLMLALYRAGRQAEALEVFQAARASLVEELGIEPGRPLRELHQQILRQDAALDLPAELEPLVETGRSAFVGRDVELAELAEGLEEALGGRGRLFLLVGEPGIGKSRLAEEVVGRARRRGARVLVGRCWEAGGAPAYWPWLQALRPYVRDSDANALRAELGPGAADVAQIIPELRQRFPDLPEPASLESEGARFRLFDATAEFFSNASRNRPIVLVLDDLHAADAPSLLLLQFLARNLASAHMLVLGAYRDLDPVPERPLASMMADIAREPVTRRLPLGGLSERDVAEYVELSAAEINSPELVAALHGDTEGNPLFVAEIVRLLALEGGPAAGARLTIPDTVRDVIARRLAHLSQECNRLLTIASALGREFALDALARLSGVSEDELLETLDEAMAARVVSDVPDARAHLRFAHVLIRDTLYDGLSAGHRARLHRLAVAALEALYGDDPGPHLPELAHHASAAGEFDKAVHYAQCAGDRALELLAYEEAARLYAAALALVKDEGVRCELLLSLGAAQGRAGNTPAARTTFVEAAEIAGRLNLPKTFASAAAGYGGRIVWERAGADVRLVPLLEEALARLGGRDVELRVRLLARLAGALRDDHSRDRREALSREAVELARHTDNPAALAYALDGRAAAIMAPDTVETCLELGTELRDLGERIGEAEWTVGGYANRLVADIILGDIEQAEADLAAQSRLVDALGQPVELFHVLAARSLLVLTRGRLDDAEQLIDEAFTLGERTQPGMAVPIYRLQRHALCDFRGNLEEIEPATRDLADEFPTRTVFRCALVYLRAKLGAREQAGRALDDLARDAFSALPFDHEWLFAMSFLAETAALLRHESGADLYPLLTPWADFNAADPHEGIRGSVSRYLGLLAATTEKWDEAARHFDEALEMNERMGARPWLAHTQHDYARALLSRGWAGDRTNAREFLTEAVATYQELGMQTYAASASALAADTA
jgi:DNA-binding SARP family transcriptional activator